MKGIVFNLLAQVVVDEHGENAWDDVLERSNLDGAYTAVGNYPDEAFMALVAAASDALDQPADDVVRWFGRRAMPHFHERYPAFFEPHSSTRGFLLTLNEVIHPEVRKLFPGAYAPSFEFDESEPDALSLSYHSTRALCSFAEGLILGAADYYGESVTVDHPACTKRGDERCVIKVGFTKGSR